VYNMIETIGNFHPMVVHFPIVCFIIAAVYEAFRLIMRKAESISTTGELLLCIGATAAVVAASLGWAGSQIYADTSTLFYHKWLGTATAASSLGVIALVVKTTNYKLHVAALVILASIVSVTGHFGGLLVHGSLF